MSLNDKLSNVLDLEPMEKQQSLVLVEPKVPDANASVELPPHTPDQEEDYTYSRDTFRSLIAKGNESIESILDIAKDLESPRAFEVVSSLLKTTSEITRELYELQKKHKEIRSIGNAAKRIDETAITVDKAVFVGTTADLLKQVKSNGQ